MRHLHAIITVDLNIISWVIIFAEDPVGMEKLETNS